MSASSEPDLTQDHRAFVALVRALRAEGAVHVGQGELVATFAFPQENPVPFVAPRALTDEERAERAAAIEQREFDEELGNA